MDGNTSRLLRPDLGCVATVPAKIETSDSTLEVGVMQTSFMVGPSLWTLSCAPLPFAVEPAQAQPLLVQMEQQANAAAGLTAVSSADVTRGGVVGRSTIGHRGDVRLRVQALIVGRWLFHQRSEGPAGRFDAELETTFFDSVRVFSPWKRCVVEDHGFAITLPVAPRAREWPAKNTPAFASVECTLPSNRGMVVAGRAQLLGPSAEEPGLGYVAALITNACNDLTEAFQAAHEAAQPFSYRGIRGLGVLLRLPETNPGVVRARFLFHQGALYRLFLVGSETTARSLLADCFFSSFELLSLTDG